MMQCIQHVYSEPTDRNVCSEISIVLKMLKKHLDRKFELVLRILKVDG